MEEIAQVYARSLFEVATEREILDTDQSMSSDLSRDAVDAILLKTVKRIQSA
jgi:F0F1-type ATP synthase delta subunit